MSNKHITLGIDCGSRTLKIVFFDHQAGKVLLRAAELTGIYPEDSAQAMIDRGLADLSLVRDDIAAICSTGYGRNGMSFADKAISEISCHARGVCWDLLGIGTVIDIGGQDSKVIRVDSQGRVLDFSMNDKCAAGTGRFLELVAQNMQTRVDRLGELAAEATGDCVIDQTCVVFAESEVIGHLARGVVPADIARAVHNSIARRIANLGSHLQWVREVGFTGGVALNPGMRIALSEVIGKAVYVPEEPLFTGALGAALLGKMVRRG